MKRDEFKDGRDGLLFADELEQRLASESTATECVSDDG